MLSSSNLVAFVPSSDPSVSRPFYETVLGLPFLGEERAALLFDSNGIVLRIVGVDEVTPQPYTVLGWEVDDIAATVSDLSARGVEFQDFDFLDDDNPPVWASPDGSKVAWFRDPDGNVLSIFQRP